MYDFKLTPAYCLFNGTAIVEQSGSKIIFMIENSEDFILQGRLKKAFKFYLENVNRMHDCPQSYKGEPEIRFVKGNREQLRRCVTGFYQADKERTSACGVKVPGEKQKDAAAVLLLESILQEARELGATDIHIEKNCVRFRIGGRLEEKMELQEERSIELIQRIKLLSGMNVIERHRCQDGRFVYGNEKPVFVRVSTVSVIGKNYMGDESVVMRLLDTSRIPLRLEVLGFNEVQLQVMEQLQKEKNGLLLVCGPTGAGKSTTVASMLVEMEKNHQGKIKIISLEDPPEYVIPGVSQIQVDKQHYVSYDEALSHVFRQDPDVIMIGEIRDESSAAVALRAALTGHLVFATLHTGGAGEALLRLENLGLERKLLSSILRGVISQELNYMEDGLNLCADIAIPKQRFSSDLDKNMGEDEIDELFRHITNYSEVLNQTLDLLKHGRKPGNKVRQIWRGGQNAKRIHQRTG